MKTKICLSVPGQKGGTERLELRYISVPGQDVLSRDRKAGQNVWDRRAGTERPGTDRDRGAKFTVDRAVPRLQLIGSPRGAAENVDATRVIGAAFFLSG